MTLTTFRRAVAGLALLVVLSGVGAARGQYSIKEAKTAPPTELAPEIQKLLDDQTVQLLDAGGNMVCELWFRKEVPSRGTPEQVKNGLTFQEFEETTLLGAVQIHKQMIDYRKNKLKQGVFTLRLSVQPQDGDHMGTAPYPEFCLLVPAARDKDPKILEPKKLHEQSAKASTATHPAVWLLFPIKAKVEGGPKLSKEAEDHWVLTRPISVKAGEVKTTIGLAITLIGVSSAA
jgi:hypothetical protein